MYSRLKKCISLIFLPFIFASCASVSSGSSYENISPDSNTLVFGRVFRQDILYTLSFDQLDFIQLNPSFPANWLSATLKDQYFVLPPIPVTGSYQLIFFKYSGGSEHFSHELGIKKDEGLLIETEKPGLLFAGSYYLTYDPADESMFPLFNRFALKEYSAKDELNALKAIQSKFKKTQWAVLIDARIKELSDVQ
jgi:hypothetical protein